MITKANANTSCPCMSGQKMRRNGRNVCGGMCIYAYMTCKHWNEYVACGCVGDNNDGLLLKSHKGAER